MVFYFSKKYASKKNQSFFLLLLSSSTLYHKTWVSCDIRITTMSWHVWECYLWKGLSDLQPDFGVVDPEIPTSTPVITNIWAYQKNSWENASCVWGKTFLLAVPSPGTPVIGLQPTSLYFPSLQNYCMGQEKHMASGIILFQYHTVSLEFVLYVISTSLQSCTKLLLWLERIEIILKKSLILSSLGTASIEQRVTLFFPHPWEECAYVVICICSVWVRSGLSSLHTGRTVVAHILCDVKTCAVTRICVVGQSLKEEECSIYSFIPRNKKSLSFFWWPEWVRQLLSSTGA